MLCVKANIFAQFHKNVSALAIKKKFYNFTVIAEKMN